MLFKFRNFMRILAKPRQLAGILLISTLIPAEAFACACGCSVFDVGSSALLPKEGDHGGAVYFEWDHGNQNINWNGLSKAPGANNGDKNVLTDWYVVGMQYMFNREWGVQVRMPYAARSFLTDANFGDTPANLQRFHVSDLADLEIMGMYTGFSKDLSTGITFGLKLPTGNFTAGGFDRDTQIGTGSTDFLLGGFHRGLITGDNAWQYFGQFKVTTPIATRSAFSDDVGGPADYRPGTQVDSAFGVTYNNWYHVGWFDKIAPVLQIIGSHRQPDAGAAAFPNDTGYDRLFISPGIEFTKVLNDAENKTFKIYGDIEIPIYERTNGNQVVAPALFKLVGAVTF